MKYLYLLYADESKMRSSMTPLASPTPARMMPVAPRAFSPAPIAQTSRSSGMPAAFAPRRTAPTLLTHATIRMTRTSGRSK